MANKAWTGSGLSLIEVIAAVVTIAALTWLVSSVIMMSGPNALDSVQVPVPAAVQVVTPDGASGIRQLQAVTEQPVAAGPRVEAKASPLLFNPLTHPLEAAIESHRRQAIVEAEAARVSPFGQKSP